MGVDQAMCKLSILGKIQLVNQRQAIIQKTRTTITGKKGLVKSDVGYKLSVYFAENMSESLIYIVLECM